MENQEVVMEKCFVKFVGTLLFCCHSLHLSFISYIFLQHCPVLSPIFFREQTRNNFSVPLVTSHRFKVKEVKAHIPLKTIRVGYPTQTKLTQTT